MTIDRYVLVGLWMVWALLCSLLSMRAFDVAVVQAMHDLPHTVVTLFQTITIAGLGKWYLWPSGLGALGFIAAAMMCGDPEQASRYRRLAWTLAFVFAAVLLSGLVSDVIKVAVGRARPKLLAEAGFYGFVPLNFRSDHQSFPSGHATTGAAVAFAVAWLWPAWRWPMMIFAAAVAASRVVIGAHFMGDVIAGLAIGWVVTWGLREWFAGNNILFRQEVPSG